MAHDDEDEAVEFLLAKITVKTNRHVIYLSFCVTFNLNLAAH